MLKGSKQTEADTTGAAFTRRIELHEAAGPGRLFHLSFAAEARVGNASG
jgi:hypothetical protein